MKSRRPAKKSAAAPSEQSALNALLAMPLVNAAALIDSWARSRPSSSAVLFFIELIKAAVTADGRAAILIDNLRKLEHWFLQCSAAPNTTFPDWLAANFRDYPSALARFRLISGNPAQVLPAKSFEDLRKLLSDDEFWREFIEGVKRWADEDAAQEAACAVLDALNRFPFDPMKPMKAQIEHLQAYIRGITRYAIWRHSRKERKHRHDSL